MHLRSALIPIVFAALGACSDFPELDDAVDSDAQGTTYPDLVPIESLNSRAPDQRITPETAPDLDSRIARLKNRAARLKGPVVDTETHERMKAGVE